MSDFKKGAFFGAGCLFVINILSAIAATWYMEKNPPLPQVHIPPFRTVEDILNVQNPG